MIMFRMCPLYNSCSSCVRHVPYQQSLPVCVVYRFIFRSWLLGPTNLKHLERVMDIPTTGFLFLVVRMILVVMPGATSSDALS